MVLLGETHAQDVLVLEEVEDDVREDGVHTLGHALGEDVLKDGNHHTL